MKARIRTVRMRDGKTEENTAEVQLRRPEPGDRPVENEVVNLYPEFTFQTVTGFGGAMTEAAAWCLTQLSPEDREAAIRAYFGKDSSGYTLIRTHIDSSDFSLGMYQAVEDVRNDPELKSFSLKRDREYIIPAVREAMRGRAAPDMLLTIRIMRYLAELCGFEVVGSIRLKRKE